MRINVGITIQMVKDEARRRIEMQYPIAKQLNVLRGADEAEIAAMDVFINHIRQRSDAIEKMEPIPADYADNRRWTSEP